MERRVAQPSVLPPRGGAPSRRLTASGPRFWRLHRLTVGPQTTAPIGQPRLRAAGKT